MLWWAALGAVVIGFTLAVLAAATKRDWLAIPVIVALLGVLTLRVMNVAEPDEPWFTPLLALAIVGLGTAGGGPLVTLLLRVGLKMPQVAGPGGGIVVDDVDTRKAKKRKRGDTAQVGPSTQEVLRGGSTIGYLERFAVIGAVLVGQAAAVAIVVAIKGLGRFTELDSAAARELFIVGTLASLIWAGACAAAIVW